MQSFTDTMRICTYDVDAFGSWKPDSMFRFMQEIAGDHSACLGFAREHLVEHDDVWMLVRAELVNKRSPQLKDTVNGLTWYGTPGKITYPRYVSLTDANGDELAFISTSWVVVSLNSRSIRLPGRNDISFPAALPDPPQISEPKRLKLAKTGFAQQFCRTATYSDLDVNGHMNNACYISWIMDLFPLSWHKEHALATLHIDYLAEVQPEQPVLLNLYGTDSIYEVQATAEDGKHILFNASLSFHDK